MYHELKERIHSMSISPIFIPAAAIAGFGFAQIAQAQESPRASVAGEQAAAASKKGERPAGYNLRSGPFSFQVQTELSLEYNDNVFNANQFVRDDFILSPSANIRAFWPITELNALTFDLGLSYDYYFRYTDLNSDLPFISPGSAVALNVFVGDFRIELHERFSYQESLNTYSYDSPGGEIPNLADTARFERFQNIVGTTVDWDLHDLILTFGYDHENYVPTGKTTYQYLERASELFRLKAAFLTSPELRPGLEIKGAIHNYADDASSTQMGDNWRAGAGPCLDWTISPYLTLEAGAGFEAIRVDEPAAQYEDQDTWYAYGRVNHRMNPWFTHSLSLEHGNEPGYNALNIERTTIRYTTSVAAIRNVRLGTVLGVSFGQEGTGGSEEDFTYYQAILRVSYQFGERWQTVLDYSFLDHSSDIESWDYDQNRVTIGVQYRL